MYKKFTLLELIIAIALIAVLISLLLPSLSEAREKAKRAVCLSNNQEMNLASERYLQDNNNRYWSWLNSPVKPGFRPYWSAGKKGKGLKVDPEYRPLNPYLDINNNSIETAVTKCPSDEYLKPDYSMSTYDYFGTSYCDNTGGNQLKKRGGNKWKTLGGTSTKPGLSRFKIAETSRMLVLFEWVVTSNGYRPLESFNGFHKEFKLTSALFADGSAKFITIIPYQIHDENFTFHWDNYWN